jgi:membrane-bound ClpP family serine protease
MDTRRDWSGAAPGAIYTLNAMANRTAGRCSVPGWWKACRRALGVVAAALLVVSGVVEASARQDGSAQGNGGASSVPAARFAKNVVVITIDRGIDATMARSVQRRLKMAAENNADAVVFELNTPGGQVEAVLDITEMIKASPIPNTVAWVHTKAYSGGAIVALACREIVVSSVARLGDAAPIVITPGGGLQSMSETERQKILAPLLADLVDSARKRGYDEKLVQGMVALGVELWLIENPQTGQRLFIDRGEYTMLFGQPPASEPLALAGTAPQAPPPPAVTVEGDAPDPEMPATPAHQPSGTPHGAAEGGGTDFIPASPAIQPDTARTASLALSETSRRPRLSAADAGSWRVIEKVSDGSTIFTFNESQLLHFGLASKEVKNDEELKTFFGATNLRRLDESWSESMVVFLTNFIVRGVLVVIFLVALFIEMTHPGVTIPGLVAAGAFILLVAPPLLNNMASWWEIAAMLVGVLLLVMEIFVIPGFGVAGVAGIILFLVGLVGTFIGAGSGHLFPDAGGAGSEVWSGVTTVVLSVATAFVIMYFLGKHFGSLPLLGRLVLTDDGAAGVDGGLLAAMAPVDRRVAPGAVGVTLTPLRPSGRVQIGEEIVDVVSDFGFIRAGARVRVASVEQFRVTVEPVDAPDRGGTPA